MRAEAVHARSLRLVGSATRSIFDGPGSRRGSGYRARLPVARDRCNPIPPRCSSVIGQGPLFRALAGRAPLCTWSRTLGSRYKRLVVVRLIGVCLLLRSATACADPEFVEDAGAAVDASTLDAGFDGATDAGFDGATDAGLDGAPTDATHDARPLDAPTGDAASDAATCAADEWIVQCRLAGPDEEACDADGVLDACLPAGIELDHDFDPGPGIVPFVVDHVISAPLGVALEGSFRFGSDRYAIGFSRSAGDAGDLRVPMFFGNTAQLRDLRIASETGGSWSHAARARVPSYASDRELDASSSIEGSLVTSPPSLDVHRMWLTGTDTVGPELVVSASCEPDCAVATVFFSSLGATVMSGPSGGRVPWNRGVWVEGRKERLVLVQHARVGSAGGMGVTTYTLTSTLVP
jgi:hypothetical protein